MSAGFSVTNLRFSYGQTCVLAGIDLAIQPGEICAVIGQSGSGKSTLIRCLLQVEQPSEGRVVYGETTIDWSDRKPAGAEANHVRRQLGYVPQSSLLLPHLSAAKNVMLPLTKAHGCGKAEAAQRAADSLRLVGVAELAQQPPWRLSGGQQQRVAIARAMAIEPQIYLLDEPTAALDIGASKIVGDVLRSDVRARSAVALIATHNLGFARLACDSIALLSHGRIAWHLRTGEVELEKAIMALA